MHYVGIPNVQVCLRLRDTSRNLNNMLVEEFQSLRRAEETETVLKQPVYLGPEVAISWLASRSFRA